MFLDFASWRAACSSLISLSRISACMGGTAPSWVRMGGRAALVRPSSGVPRCPWLAPAAPSTSAPPPSISWNCSSGMIGVWLVEFSLFLSLACWCVTPHLCSCVWESQSQSGAPPPSGRAAPSARRCFSPAWRSCGEGWCSLPASPPWTWSGHLPVVFVLS